MKGKKIIIISPYAEPETGAPIARTHFFKEVLEGNGFETRVLAPQKPGVDKAHGVMRYDGKLGLFKILWKEKPALAIATGPPPQVIFDTEVCAKLLGFPIIADVRDPWTKAKLALGILQENSLKHHFQQAFEKTVYSLAKKIFAVSPAVASEIKALGIKKEKITVIEHSVDTNIFRRDLEAGKKVRKEMSIGQKPLLIYVGNAWVGIDRMIEKISSVIREKDYFLLLILSKNPFESEEKFEKIREAIMRGETEKNTKVLFNIPHQELFKYLSAADIGLNIIPAKLTYVVSNKVKEYMACGVPVSCRCSQNCYSREFIEKHAIGIVSFSWEEFAEKTSALINSKKLEGFRKTSIKESKKFSNEKIGNKVIREIENIL